MEESSCEDFVQSQMIITGSTVWLSQRKKKQKKEKLNDARKQEIKDYFPLKKN